ncbi:hypothetical protein BDM02DRAFT_3193067 [Thelephora ganbajun]|uniref:Uncharacterized protein n=1 Tax=Thelephora ganbajun TaxID=370292 RepID=A0ACB6YZ86_THEGA|nr:hypothetical protein BDM02DRAFT_3193067 [Thelephora ganbajun]
MTLENNQTFISPRNQRVSCIDARAHSKDGRMTDNAYRFPYPTMASLVDAMISQEDNEFPRRQFAAGCSFDDIIWQQAIGALKNIDHTHCGNDNRDDEHVLFSLLQAGLVNHQVFDLPHKWLSRSIRYSAMVADCLWALHTAEHARNNCLEAELNTLKGEVHLLSTRLLAVDCFSFDANTKVNKELKKDGDRLNRHHACLNMITKKHNSLIKYITNMLNQLELQCTGLLALHENICLCNVRSESAEAPAMSSPSLSPTPPEGHNEDPEAPAAVVSSEVPEENMTPIPVPAPGSSSRSCCPPRHVQESTTTLRVITQEEEREIKDRLVGAWQAQGQAGVNASTLVGSESNETSNQRCVEPIVGLTPAQVVTLSPEARGYRLLSMMRAVTMMPNTTVFSCLRSYDFIGGELQLVFPIAQEDFDALMSGELSAEVCPITISEVVRSGASEDIGEEDDKDDGWITDCSVVGLK